MVTNSEGDLEELVVYFGRPDSAGPADPASHSAGTNADV
jgi:hypothetical protein